jgi:hypothetical protein
MAVRFRLPTRTSFLVRYCRTPSSTTTLFSTRLLSTQVTPVPICFYGACHWLALACGLPCPGSCLLPGLPACQILKLRYVLKTFPPPLGISHPRSPPALSAAIQPFSTPRHFTIARWTSASEDLHHPCTVLSTTAVALRRIWPTMTHIAFLLAQWLFDKRMRST